MEPYRDPPFEAEGGDLVEIASHQSSVEAELSRQHLAEHGIAAAVQESASFNPMISIAAGGTRLLVRAADESRARYLLRRLAHAQPADEEEPGEVRCPRCELTYCTFGTALAATSLGPFAAPGIVLLLLPLGLTRKRWRCQKCLHVWDDRDLGPKRRTPLDPEDPHPVFRLRRHRAGTGVAAGLGLLFAVMVLARGVGIPPPMLGVLALVLLVLPVLGYTVGRRSTMDVCSAPECRAPLPRGAKECRACNGTIAGVIHDGSEHWSETASVRRELWALRSEKKRPRLPAGKGAEKPRKKKKAAPEREDE